MCDLLYNSVYIWPKVSEPLSLNYRDLQLQIPPQAHNGVLDFGGDDADDIGAKMQKSAIPT